MFADQKGARVGQAGRSCFNPEAPNPFGPGVNQTIVQAMVLLLALGAHGPSLAAGPEETGPWSGSGSGPFSSMAHVVIVTATTTVSGNAAVSSTPSGAFGTNDFWSPTLTNDASLELRLVWDSIPESGGTDIDLGTDDKGSGTLTFTFDQAITDPILHIDRIGGQAVGLSNSVQLTLTTGGATLTKLSGTDDFDVTATTIQRRPDVATNAGAEADQDVNTGTAAGSVRVNGTVTSVSFNWTGVGVEGTGADQLEFIWTVPAPLAIVKRAFQLDGTTIPTGTTLPSGLPVRFLLYISNPGGPVVDVSMQDVLDPTFLYMAGSIRYDASITSCAAATCTALEEAAIFAAADSGAVRTDAVDSDVVSFTGVTLDVGNQSAANTELDISGGKVWAVVFTIRMQ